MSKEEFLKIQKCVLKVNIHCDGCKQKVKKILRKIDGVFTTEIDAEQGKVIVSGNVDPTVLIKKLAKSGKHAELWGAPKPNNNKNQLSNQFKGMQIDNDKGGNNNKGQKGGNNQPKGGGHGQQQQQQLHQLQQMKGLQDLNLPQFKDLKMPNQNSHQKAAKFNLPEDEDLSDDEFDDEFDDEDFDEDDELDDEFDDPTLPLNKMKPGMPMPNGHAANMMMNGVNGVNGLHPQLINAQMVGSVAGNGKNGGGGHVAVPIPMNAMGGEHDAKNGNGGKKGGGGGGGSNPNEGGKNGGGFPHEGKSGNNSGGVNKNIHGNGGAHGNNNGNGVKKGNGAGEGFHHTSNGFPKMGGHPAMAAANVGPVGNMNIPPMAQMNSMSMGQTGSIPAVHGLPIPMAAMNGGGDAGYFQGSGPEVMAGNPYHSQQQYLTTMMNQQRAMGNDRFQPMMNARPPPAVNYMPPYPYYPPPPPADSYTHYFNDENASSCSVM